MPRSFNIAGPCVPGDHYQLPALDRLPQVRCLIDAEQVFVLHAPRQVGKTTLLIALARELENKGHYRAMYLSVETAHRIDDGPEGVTAVAERLRMAVRMHPSLRVHADALPMNEHWTQRIQLILMRLCELSDKPLVLLIDEADCLGGETLISVLRQLRDGYVSRGQGIAFPHSLALVGMRDVRDFKVQIRPGSQTLGSASPFNIVSKSLTLRNFTNEEVATLYGQYASEGGSPFPTAAIDLAFERSQGQPWLVNAIAREVVEEILEFDRSRPIATEMVARAIENIILRRATHLDSLIERLREDRVRRIVEPVILGEDRAQDLLSDDLRYCVDLGLLTATKGVVKPACPIYAEVMARALSWSAQGALPLELEHRWIDGDHLDLDGLLAAFQQFWRENADIWVGKEDYREAAPHLILMAFLQRVINGGAQIIREFAAGRKRLDIDVILGERHHPIELKLWRGPKSREEGLDQLAKYCRHVGAKDAWLVLFDRREGRTWDERITWETIERDGLKLRLVGG